MSGQAEPPQMSDSPVLEAAHRDLKRRRAKWAGLGSAAAVVAVAAMVAVLAPSGSDGGGIQAGTQPSVPANGSGGNNTEKSWPNGQIDRTATSGAEHDRAATLADKLAEVSAAGRCGTTRPTCRRPRARASVSGSSTCCPPAPRPATAAGSSRHSGA